MTAVPSGPLLRSLTVSATDAAEAGTFLAAVCGVTTTAATPADHVRIQIDDAALLVGPSSDPDRVGITGIEVQTETSAGTSTRLNGIDVVTTPDAGRPPTTTAAGADIMLDHVAVAVADLDEAAREWEAATGATAELIGIHPVSNGSLLAARLSLGDRMVELLSPVPGVDSAIAARLERRGEGPIALALPAKDIESKRKQLDELGVRMLWQAPHWLIHPANPANILIQLTPRVRH